MASPHLDIAKVSFAALLLRPDPTAQSRAEIDDFLRILDTTISRCSPANVQQCKQWIVANIAHSPARTAALLKYLTALARSLTRPLLESRQAREPSSRRRRLHILYVLNDALYHTRARTRDETFSKHIEAGLPELLRLAASYTHCARHMNKICDLLKIWKEEGYVTAASYDRLMSTVRDAPNNAVDESASAGKTQGSGAPAPKAAKNAPFLMPAIHGDATAAWYDLPAASWLPVMEPNSTRPMNPEMIKPLQFKPGPAEAHLVDAVKTLLADADRLFAKEHAIGEDDDVQIDQLGQPIVRDEITGEIIGGQTYYGWSRGFCEKMKQRRAKNDKPQNVAVGAVGEDAHMQAQDHARARGAELVPDDSLGLATEVAASFQPPIPPPPFPVGAEFNNGFPAFPPRPPNFQGQWPPPIPPPPIPPQGVGAGFPQAGWVPSMPGMMPAWNGAIPPPPPPPPLPQHSLPQGPSHDQFANQHYGARVDQYRGGGQGGHHGQNHQGGWGRGRGW
ncbi:uncharacterized protein B0I36DRAFT_348203 [Microdochium trichocladiopsis]|uniref:CID domain-containing protein n=1 Tax=Microdochium trichocladiopsis TaxID=1682393 RepID=A0A9P8Y9K3_9PEZI|nr:uncharacterized protein B0I36DRAFT_348203 [Microdochium trichocladiopsis]KAH7033091.1 hypothetical protein B0I36DRAFT_348203 [Microdochium trichocladiopsis]